MDKTRQTCQHSASILNVQIILGVVCWSNKHYMSTTISPLYHKSDIFCEEYSTYVFANTNNDYQDTLWVNELIFDRCSSFKYVKAKNFTLLLKFRHIGTHYIILSNTLWVTLFYIFCSIVYTIILFDLLFHYIFKVMLNYFA